MRYLSIDIETYSDVDIKKSGMYAYVRSPEFQILLNAFCLQGEMRDPIVLDYSVEDVVPYWFVGMLTNPGIRKRAYNANFERQCFSAVLGIELPADQWEDTMLQALYCGYPTSLEAAGSAIGLEDDKRKLRTGKDLIRFFCSPCKPTKSNGGRTRNLPEHDPEKWAMFKEYNKQDVVTEMEIAKRLSAMPVPAFVQKQWQTDSTINGRGVHIDMELVSGAIDIAAQEAQRLKAEAVAISGLRNPASVRQLTDWLKLNTDEEITTLRKADVADLKEKDISLDAKRLLEIRQELGKTSTKKYDAVQACICPDGRIRGMLQFYGANRTGRWAGRFVQVQNLPRTYLDMLDFTRDLVKQRSADALRVIYGSVYDTLSQLIRTLFTATPGNVLIDADFSAIEARVISWLAGEEWRLEVFRTHGKIYEASASQMFGVPMDRIKKGNPEYALRAKGKVAELALGYQGGSNALITMGALKMGLDEDELPDIVTRWRASNPHIQALWWAFNNAAIDVIEQGGYRRVGPCIIAREWDQNTERSYMTIQLPTGRKLYYVSPRVGENRWGQKSIEYLGINDKNNTHKWGYVETYGGKLVENTVQAIARDCLADTIERLETAGFPIVFHIHDEVVIDIKPNNRTPEQMLEQVIKIMAQPIPWAPGLPLGADGWTGQYFKKD